MLPEEVAAPVRAYLADATRCALQSLEEVRVLEGAVVVHFRTEGSDWQHSCTLVGNVRGFSEGAVRLSFRDCLSWALWVGSPSSPT
jgi:hypothetical protein